MRMIRSFFAALAMMSLPAAVNAQPTDVPFLGGLRTFTITIADLGGDAASCDVTRTGLYTSLRSVLRDSDMDITDNVRTRDGIIYLRVTVLADCTASIALNVQTAVTVNKTGQGLYAPVWERERVRTVSNKRGAGAAIRDSVEGLATALVDDWNSVNS